MKILIASDIHGDAEAMRAVIAKFAEEGAERLVLLGDLLYHGPRNDLPATYAPKEVITLLNGLSPAPLCVRGNCEAEVDQMVLNFPVLAEYAWLHFDGISVFATHGHHHNPENLPPLGKNEVLLSGHTHIPTAAKNEQGVLCLNPGSAALPKGGFPKSYMLYENRRFTVKSFSGEVICEASV